MTGYTAMGAAAALTCACREDDAAAALEVLAAHPQAVNWRVGATRKTALHFAIELGSHDVADVLISQGADVMAADSDGVTAMSLLLRRDWRRAAGEAVETAIIGDQPNPVAARPDRQRGTRGLS